MEFVITRGQFEIHPLPSQHPEAPEGSRGGYLLNIVDEHTGILIRVSMAHANAAQLGQALVDDTTAYPWQEPALLDETAVLNLLEEQMLNGGERPEEPS